MTVNGEDRRGQSSLAILSLIFASVLSGTVLIPTVRPFFAAFFPGHEGALHAFMGVNMMGAVVGAPLLSLIADRTGRRKSFAIVLAFLDAICLFGCAFVTQLPLLMVLRFVQGAINVGALSILFGAVRARSTRGVHGGSVGMAGAALVFAVAAGAPIGTSLLPLGPRAPLMTAAALELFVMIGTWMLPDWSTVPTGRVSLAAVLRSQPHLKLPMIWVGVERFAVGCFVVTFSLYAHARLGISDQRIGALMSWFVLPFAFATYPMGRLADRMNRAALVAMGLGVYGLCFLGLGLSSTAGLPALLCLTGIASASIYAPGLCLGAGLVPSELRATAMGFLNASGSLGMMFGTALAGIVSGILKHHGWGAKSYVAVFFMAGAASLLALLGTARALWKLGLHHEESPNALRALVWTTPQVAVRRPDDLRTENE